MKLAAILVVVTILAILVIAEVIALADTNSFPPVVCAAPIAGNIMRVVPPLAFQPGQPLPPGIYETRPFAMTLKVPELTADNCVLHVGTPPPMPVLHPELQVIPKVAPISEAKK